MVKDKKGREMRVERGRFMRSGGESGEREVQRGDKSNKDSSNETV